MSWLSIPSVLLAVVKHLPGQHDQKTHGGKGGGAGASGSAASGGGGGGSRPDWAPSMDRQSAEEFSRGSAITDTLTFVGRPHNVDKILAEGFAHPDEAPISGGRVWGNGIYLGNHPLGVKEGDGTSPFNSTEENADLWHNRGWNEQYLYSPSTHLYGGMKAGWATKPGGDPFEYDHQVRVPASVVTAKVHVTNPLQVRERSSVGDKGIIAAMAAREGRSHSDVELEWFKFKGQAYGRGDNATAQDIGKFVQHKGYDALDIKSDEIEGGYNQVVVYNPRNVVVIDPKDDPSLHLFKSANAAPLLFIKGYNPNEPRDARGRWTSHGGGDQITTGAASARQREAVDEWMAANGYTRRRLLAQSRAVLDRASPEALAYGTHWYGEAHRISHDLADRHGVDLQTAAGVVAALSPREKWHVNPDGSPNYTKSGNLQKADAVLRAVRSTEAVNITAEVARMVTKRYKVPCPTGTHGMQSLHPVARAALKVSGLASNIAKGARIAAGEHPRDVLGGPKVRSFFNNINSPGDSTSVTIDTHQMRAMLGDISLSEKHYTEVAGHPARYDHFADVIHTVARERGLRAHQVQGIMWEQWRLEHPIGERRKANRDNIAAGLSQGQWTRAEDGEEGVDGGEGGVAKRSVINYTGFLHLGGGGDDADA